MQGIAEELANKPLVVTFSPTGVVSALHMDKHDLGYLGNKRMGRASTIEFNEDEQSFFVLPDGEKEPLNAASHFSGYDVARSFEIDWLQQCMIEECTPYSKQGKIIAFEIRYENRDGLYPVVQ